MAQRTGGLHAVLSFSWVYDLFQNVVGARRSRKKIVDEIIKPTRGQRILDVGCGTAAILEFLADVKYVGIDLSEQYIETARHHFGTVGEFHVGTADELGLAADGKFDVVLATGLLHHLDDDEVLQLFKTAETLLAPNGRLITIDPTFVSNQHPLARLLIKSDRGLNVRTKIELLTLARKVFPTAAATVRTDLLRIPYTHLVLEAEAAPTN